MRSQGLAGIVLEHKRLGAEVVLDLIYPPVFDQIRISEALRLKLIQECDVLLHVAQTSAAGTAALFGQYSFNAVVLENGLHGGFSKAQDLPLTVGHQHGGVEKQSIFPRKPVDEQDGGELSFAGQLFLFLISPQLGFKIDRHSGGNLFSLWRFRQQQ